MGDRSAAGADRRNLDHRRADDEAEVDRRLGGERRGAAGDQRNVERSAAEIGGDHIGITRRLRDRGGGDDARGGTRKRRAHRKPARHRGRHHAAVRLHDMETSFEAVARQRRAELFQVGADDRLQIGVDRRRRRSLELPDLRQDFRGDCDILIGPDGARGFRRGAFVGRIGVGVDEDDRQRLRALGAQAARGFLDGGEIDRLAQRAIRQSAFADLDAQVAIGDRREIAPEAPGARPVATPHLQNVAKAAGRDEANPAAFALQQGVRADRCAVNDRTERRDATGPRRRSPSMNPAASSPRLDGALAVAKRRLVASNQNRSVKVPPTSTPTIVGGAFLGPVMRRSARATPRVAAASHSPSGVTST